MGGYHGNLGGSGNAGGAQGSYGGGAVKFYAAKFIIQGTIRTVAMRIGGDGARANPKTIPDYTGGGGSGGGGRPHGGAGSGIVNGFDGGDYPGNSYVPGSTPGTIVYGASYGGHGAGGGVSLIFDKSVAYGGGPRIVITGIIDCRGASGLPLVAASNAGTIKMVAPVPALFVKNDGLVTSRDFRSPRIFGTVH
jgi:hypothetical protein